MSGKSSFLRRFNNLRVKLIALPLLLLFIAVFALASITYVLVQRNMIEEVQRLGLIWLTRHWSEFKRATGLSIRLIWLWTGPSWEPPGQ